MTKSVKRLNARGITA